MKQYLNLLSDVFHNGMDSDNRTGIPTRFKLGTMLKFDLADGFPAVTTKKLSWKAAFAEMLGFLRAYDNAQDFGKLGCNVWHANANSTPSWLNNPHRKGENDLGRIYGVQAREWRSSIGHTDQLRDVYERLKRGEDNRRLLVNHWNVGELDEMALPPCHVMYQFGIDVDKRLSMAIYIRSSDLFLGLPFNIAGYAWLLSAMAHITGHKPGVLTVFLFNYHIYANHFDQVIQQLSRVPYDLPRLEIDYRITSLKDLETWVTVDHFDLIGYQHHPFIYAPMAA